MPLPLPAVAPARPAPVNDRLLAQLRYVAHAAPQSLATEAEAEWLVSVCGPLLDELAAWRALGAARGLTLEAANVIILPGRA